MLGRLLVAVGIVEVCVDVEVKLGVLLVESGVERKGVVVEELDICCVQRTLNVSD